MKKVLVGYISRGKTSGIDRYLLGVIKNVDRSTYTLDFLTRINEKSVQDLMAKNDFGLYQIPRNRHILKQFFAIKKIIKNKHYDIAYFNISESYNCIGLIAAKIFGVKHVIVHSHSSGSDGNFFAKNIKRLLNFIFKPIVYSLADEFYACSDCAAKWLFTRRIIKTHQYKLIPNAIDFTKFAHTPNEQKSIRKIICEKYHIPLNAAIIGHIGRFTHAKNNCFLIDILKETLKTKNTYLICVGEHTEDFNKFQNYAARQGVKEYIITPGIQTDTSDFYQAFDIFVLPSRFEGLPIVAIEAQASNLPCILSDRIDSAVKISKQAVFLPINNPKSWAQKILDFTKIKPHSNPLLEKAKQFNSTEPSEDIFAGNHYSYQSKSYDLAIYLFFALHYLFNLTNIFNGLHLFLYPGAACALLVFIHRITHRLTAKPLLKDPLCRLLILFYISYLITAIFVTLYNPVGLIKTAIWTAFYLFFAFNYKLHQNLKNINYEIKQFFIYIVIIISLINLANLVLLLLGISTKIVSPLTNSEILIGYAPWGRFYGLFYDPNYASVVCTCAILFSVYLIQHSKSLLTRILLALANVLQLTYMLAGQSRTGFIALGVGLVCYIVITLVTKTFKTIPKNRFLSGIILSIVTILLPLGIIKLPVLIHQASQSARSTYQTTDTTQEDDQDLPSDITISDVKTPILKLQRTDNRGDISNRRFDIWKSGFEIFSYSETNKVLGVGHSNVVDYAKDRIPETYIVNNSFQDFDAFHNALIDLLVSQGLLGFFIILIIIIYLIYLAIKNHAVLAKYPLVTPLFSALIAICASSMFVSEIFYINNCCTFIFWVLLGYYYYFLQTNNQKRKHLS
ncbi:MAG: glycosyltransferase [Candidatus Saccharibacteria bacterium]|nr:glycosyltransferase [Candidatus Saccharibacteria bacterium]